MENGKVRTLLMCLIATAAALLFAPPPASAEPVFLSCFVDDGTERTEFSLSVNEDSGRITHTHSSGEAFNADGFFSSNTITFQNIIGGGSLIITYKYEINRTTLAVVQTFTVEPSDPNIDIPGTTIISSGSCEITDNPDRQI